MLPREEELAPESELPPDWFDVQDLESESGLPLSMADRQGHRHHVPDIHDDMPPEGFDWLDEGLGDA